MNHYELAQKVKLPDSEDRRKKLTAKQREEILTHRGKTSQRETARMFGVSRSLVTFLWYPERYAKHLEQARIRRIDGRYKISVYETKEQWASRQREYKNRKYRLYQQIKSPD